MGNPKGRGRQIEGGIPEGHDPGRGSSIQGPRQNAKGGPDGANQGGASRGSSRLEPSHQKRQLRQDKKTGR